MDMTSSAHGPKVMGSNLGQIELRVDSPSGQSGFYPKITSISLASLYNSICL